MVWSRCLIRYDDRVGAVSVVLGHPLLERGAGLNHCPSGKFNANAAWLVLTALAHNLLRGSRGSD